MDSEKTNMNIRESELQEIIARDSVTLSEDEMRKLEEAYQQIQA